MRFIFRGLSIFALISAANVFGASISSFTPMIGPVGTQVTINGSGFFPGTLVVKFNGVTDPTAQATAANGTVIQAQVPPGAPLGPGPITVQVNGGAPASSLQDFTVIGSGPYITGFSPATGGQNQEVFIDGLNFQSANVTNAYFNGRVGTSFQLQSDIRIRVLAPAGVTTGPISVRSTFGGTNTTATNFFVPPIITGFSPTNGRAGTNVLIRGTNFLGTLSVRFGGVFASNFNVLSNGAVSVTVPSNAVTGAIRLDAPAGSAITTSNFSIAPTIFGFTPGFGPVGTPVVITGANFTNPTVRFNGVTASATNVSFGQLTAIVPATTSGPISITTPDGTAVSSNLFYLPARITSLSPSNGPPGTLVTVIGVNFTNASSVTFNGTPAANFFVTNNTNLGAIVPFGVTTGPITVTTPAGTTNSTGLFYGVPGITVFSPTHGLPGTNVTITGSNFLGATAVLFNGLPAADFFVTNNTTIVAIVPNGAQTGPITVRAPGGTNTTAVDFVLDYTSELSVTINDTPDPVLVTSNLVYVITINNNGPFNTTELNWSNTLPASVVLKAATASQGTLATNSNPITGNLGVLNSGGSATVTLTVAPQTPGVITNRVTVGSGNIDPALSNNTATALSTVLPLPLLSIRRTAPDRVRLAWPSALSNFFLQSRNSLSVTSSWANVTNQPTLSGDEKVVIETNNVPSRFYRLRS